MPTEVVFATNRTQPKSKGAPFGKRFHTDGPHFYEVGHASIAWTDPSPQDRDWDSFDFSYEMSRGKPPPVPSMGDDSVPEMHRKAGGKEVTGTAKVFRALRDDMQKTNKDVLIYIHGFANSLDSAIARAAQLKEIFRIAPPQEDQRGEPYEPYVFAFCWPSDGKVQPPWKYASDRDDAALSGVAMARALRRFVDFLNEGEPCRMRLHLVAHSMGNWALRHAVLGLRALMDQGRLPRIFENAFLMAADEDEDCFESADKMMALTELAKAIHVYHARNDLALEVSDKTKGNMDRLGTNGPRTFSGISNRITAIDCSKVSSTDIGHGNHQYYRLRKEVIADVQHVLSGRFRADEVPGRLVVEPGRRYRIEG